MAKFSKEKLYKAGRKALETKRIKPIGIITNGLMFVLFFGILMVGIGNVVESVIVDPDGNCTSDEDCQDNQFCCNNSGFCGVAINKCINLTCADFQYVENHKCVLNSSFNFSMGYPLNVKDNCGNNITIYSKPQRIVSAAPSATETLYAVGGGNLLVGRSQYCNYPPDVQNVPIVTGFYQVNPETIINASPDLILFGSCDSQSDYNYFKNLGYNAIILGAHNISEILNNIMLLGQIINKSNDSQNVISQMNNNISIIQEKVTHLKRHPKIFQVTWYPEMWTTGNNTFINSYIKIAGGTNIFEDANGWFTANKENVIQRNPDMILLTGMGPLSNSTIYAGIKNDDALKDINAVKREQFCMIDNDPAARPGPRVTVATNQLYDCIKKWDDEYCGNDNECSSGYYCKEDNKCYKKTTSTDGSTGGTSGRGGYTGYVQTQPSVSVGGEKKNIDINTTEKIPGEIVSESLILNLGSDMKGATVEIDIGGKISKGTADASGTVIVLISEYGNGEIKISKSGYNDYKKTITIYAGKLNITKISGEKYGDKFRFKVTDEKGNVMKQTEVEIFGEKMKTDGYGIAEKEMNTIQTGLVATATKRDYKDSVTTYDIKAIGKVKIDVPKTVNEGDKVTIKIKDENDNPVANAKVEVNGKEYMSNKNGEIELTATQTMALKAVKDGYISSEMEKITVTAKVRCGDGKCDVNETKENCPQDCVICGDNVCDKGENYESCPSDCKKEYNTLLYFGMLPVIIIILVAAYLLVIKKKRR